MPQKKQPHDPKLFGVVDYNDATELYVDDIAAVIENGPIVNVVFTTTHTPSGSQEHIPTERRVTLRLFIPAERLSLMGQQLLAGSTCATAARVPRTSAP